MCVLRSAKCNFVILFRQYVYRYDGSEASWETIGLKPNKDDSTWADVQDFHWHKTTPSPNWKLAQLAQAGEVFDLTCLDRLHDDSTDEC